MRTRRALQVIVVAAGAASCGRDTGPRVDAVLRFESATALVARLGDVNGDGRPEFLVANPADGTGGTRAGLVRALSGLDLRIAWEVHGEPEDRLGTWIAGVGDVSGDGIPDWITCVCGLDPDVGHLHVRSGVDGSRIRSFEVLETKTRILDAVHSAPYVRPAGDLDGDGLTDLLVREPAPGTFTPPWIQKSGAPVALENMRCEVRSVLDGRVVLDLPSVWFFLGPVGDLDGDSRSDLLVRERSGAHTILSGRDGTTLRLLDEEWRERSGQGDKPVHLQSATSLGDIDADGVDDFATVEFDSALWIVSGRTTSITGVVPAEQPFSGFGYGLDTVGDLDGDGVVDLAIGTPSHDNLAAALDYGHVAIVSGRTGHEIRSFQGDLEHRSLGDEITALGDLDGDGYEELGVSAHESVSSGLEGFIRIYSGRRLR